MSTDTLTSLPEPAAAALTAQLGDALDTLTSLSMECWSDVAVVEFWRELETQRNRFAMVDHALVVQAQTRHLPFEYGAKSDHDFIRQLLRISRVDAAARVKAAAALAWHVGLTGEVLAPTHPKVAAAQAAGELCPAAARIITSTVENLPYEVAAELEDQITDELLVHARRFDVDALTTIAKRTADTIDPDGRYRDLDEQARKRDVTVQRRADGSGRLSGDLTSELTEHLLTHFDSLAAPKPAADGSRDLRSYGQRCHDALLDCLKLVERADLLPTCKGVAATIVISMTEAAFRTGQGTATTAHGTTLPADVALAWAGGDARTMGVTLNDNGAVTGHTRTVPRLFSETQRLAMYARDKGCAFPDCDVPPHWCESHHIREHHRGGPTTPDNGVLLCGYHHDHFEEMKWVIEVAAGIPWFIPPPHVDYEQRPIRNHRWHPPPATTP